MQPGAARSAVRVLSAQKKISREVRVSAQVTWNGAAVGGAPRWWRGRSRRDPTPDLRASRVTPGLFRGQREVHWSRFEISTPRAPELLLVIALAMNRVLKNRSRELRPDLSIASPGITPVHSTENGEHHQLVPGWSGPTSDMRRKACLPIENAAPGAFSLPKEDLPGGSRFSAGEVGGAPRWWRG